MKQAQPGHDLRAVAVQRAAERRLQALDQSRVEVRNAPCRVGLIAVGMVGKPTSICLPSNAGTMSGAREKSESISHCGSMPESFRAAFQTAS